MPIPTISSPAVGMGVEQLTNLMFQYYRELQYLLGGQLDSTNVREITTDKLYAGDAWVNTLVAGQVTTTYVNALNITAGSVAAENITGTKITGKTIVGGKFMDSSETHQLEIGTVGSDVGFIFSKSNGDKLFGVYDMSGLRIDITGKGNIPFIVNDGTFPGKTYPYGAWDFGSCTISNFPGYTHTHDDRYYTETEADGRYATSGHDHGNAYVKTSQNLKIQWFSDHIEVSADGGSTWDVINFV